MLTFHTAETSLLTADPKIRLPNAFRTARQTIHDGIVAGSYAAKVAKEKKLIKWMGCSPDYAYGRESNQLFFEYTKHFFKDIEVIGESWPKLFQADYTEQLTKILQAKPDAISSARSICTLHLVTGAAIATRSWPSRGAASRIRVSCWPAVTTTGELAFSAP